MNELEETTNKTRGVGVGVKRRVDDERSTDEEWKRMRTNLHNGSSTLLVNTSSSDEESMKSLQQVLEGLCNSRRSEDDPTSDGGSSKPSTGHPARDEEARDQERHGIIQLHVIAAASTKNNSSAQVQRWLLQAVDLFSRQLPEMPRKSIARTVFDGKHRTLVMVKKKKVEDSEELMMVVGGICFRIFPHQHFSEIVYCAVSMEQQVKGYGTHLMNHLKDYHIKQGIHHFLTYADKTANGFFLKQGFTKKLKLKRRDYMGVIKHYDFADLMGCELNPDIIYTELSQTIKKQNQIIAKLVEQPEQGQPGLDWRDGCTQIPLRQIPGISERAIRLLEKKPHKTKLSRSTGRLGGS